MKNLVVMCLLFGGLLFFSESEIGQKTIVGGVDVMAEVIVVEDDKKPKCTYNKAETDDCPNQTNDEECTRTYTKLFSDADTRKDWADVPDAVSAEACRTVDGVTDTKCGKASTNEVTSFCEEVAATGGGGKPGTEVVIFD